MLNREDLEFLSDFLEAVPESNEIGVKVRSKVNLLLEQLDLQDEFRTRSLEIQQRQEELAR